jgi:hypothetical protein
MIIIALTYAKGMCFMYPSSMLHVWWGDWCLGNLGGDLSDTGSGLTLKMTLKIPLDEVIEDKIIIENTNLEFILCDFT